MRSASPKLRLILGTLTIGPELDHGGEVIDPKEARGIFSDLVSLGYHEVDCASVHGGGRCEPFLKEAGWRDFPLSMATKDYPHQAFDHVPETLAAHIDRSLEYLGTQSVDIFYLHNVDRTVPLQPALKVVNDAHKAGKFKTFGLSNMTAAEAVEIALTCKYNGWVRPTVFQLAYNVLTRGAELEAIPILRRFGFDIVVYNPTAGGFMSDKFLHEGTSSGYGRFGLKGPYAKYYRPKRAFPTLLSTIVLDHVNRLTLHCII